MTQHSSGAGTHMIGAVSSCDLPQGSPGQLPNLEHRPKKDRSRVRTERAGDLPQNAASPPSPSSSSAFTLPCGDSQADRPCEWRQLLGLCAATANSCQHSPHRGVCQELSGSKVSTVMIPTDFVSGMMSSFTCRHWEECAQVGKRKQRKLKPREPQGLRS